MALSIVGPEHGQRNDLQAVEDLGAHMHKIAALLRAAMNTGAGKQDRDDSAWLVSIAQDEAELAEARYAEWALPEGEEAK